MENEYTPIVLEEKASSIGRSVVNNGAYISPKIYSSGLCSPKVVRKSITTFVKEHWWKDKVYDAVL